MTKEGIVNFCRFCRRYLRPPWTMCERESKELLSICLKRLRGLSKVKIIDASFVYTDPSTKRIKVKLTIAKEILNNTSL
jgi:nonsense-mediated mRNA decay protein 3